MSATTGQPQLSLDVHPHAALDEDDLLLVGSLKVKGAFRISRDLNAGDELLVIVQNPDGEVLCSSHAEVESPRFKTIKDKGTPIGTERAHTAELLDR